MPFDIRFDTRFDPTGFFEAPGARAALEEAGRIWEEILRDDFAPVPAGIAFDIEDPSALGTTRRIVLDAPIDDLLIFVGAEALGGGMLALGGPDGFGRDGQSLGTAYEARVSGDFRGQGPVTDFEPWAGGITFDTGTAWSFAPGPPAPGSFDFLSIALHEIGHVLGFGTAPIFTRLAREGGFDGPNARAANGGVPVPLEPDLGHVAEGFAGDSVLMDPILGTGARLMPTALDRAILADIGWEIAGFETQGATPPLATAGDDATWGSAVADTLSGGAGDDRLDGGAGADLLIGGPGDDAYLIDDPGDCLRERAGEGRDTVIASADVTLGGAEVEAVFLTGAAPLRVTGNGVATAISGNRGDNLLIGGGGGDLLTGNRGADTFVFLRGESGPPARIADFGPGDRIALDDRLFGLGDGAIDARPVTAAQVAAVLRAGQAAYDGRSGTLSVAEGEGLRALVVIEGGGRIEAEDLLLF
ncbi:hypothetical protein [Jannaschia formosa]|uniref:hypothetical protein n=1 Tax=Jannaschia formosa TaxID=2259592 RepID=UPI000E1C1757|nr:hypothetical protein [Jannaschia formosa]TFL17090.1 hypothetical protein DR046_16250 [Jannaschia formosa]